jgi:hypothetical protein
LTTGKYNDKIHFILLGRCRMLDSTLMKRLNDEVLVEISRHRWFESEKAGCDIGANAAAYDWLEKHYEKWFLSRDYLKSIAV